MRHAGGVEGGAEDGDAIVRGSEGFDAFVGLLPVVQCGRETVDGEVGRGDEGGSGPSGGVDGVVAFDVPVHFADFEADGGPVCSRW